ncbi:hypothetical protein ACN38_g4286 [Penicillium nordicum]|uniref:Uncharacterized protein n=1 Tax=Penicillium nordicum TaxID=229535 RepID=A0A0M9WH88_9EURO|nr:hypothetical protein ACN38_g4286 [Penicillium nordicum]
MQHGFCNRNAGCLDLWFKGMHKRARSQQANCAGHRVWGIPLGLDFISEQVSPGQTSVLPNAFNMASPPIRLGNCFPIWDAYI